MWRFMISIWWPRADWCSWCTRVSACEHRWSPVPCDRQLKRFWAKGFEGWHEIRMFDGSTVPRVDFPSSQPVFVPCFLVACRSLRATYAVQCTMFDPLSTWSCQADGLNVILSLKSATVKRQKFRKRHEHMKKKVKQKSKMQRISG